MAKKPWSGRFKDDLANDALAYSVSLDTDLRLYEEDIEASIAHAKALADADVLKDEELKRIIAGLKEVKKEISKGLAKLDPKLEDIHMNIEHLLIKKVGKVGMKIHTARSRNDQVLTDLKMYVKGEIKQIDKLIKDFQRSLVFVAEKYFNLIMPGYTHKQRAQPILFSHHIMAYFEMFDRDRGRLADIMKRVDVLPLGSGAVAGVNYKIDRTKLAKSLNFGAVSENSVDAVSDRDFVIELISIISIIMMHFSRMSEELILWSSQEYSFIELPDRYTTGSSIMPQKKNPDMAELTRGRAGKVYGNLMAILTIMKGLPLAYNRDLQEDKPVLFESIDIVKATLKIFAPMIRGMKVNNLTMLSATETGHLTATDLADYLVVKGIPFRQAHHLVGNIVRYAIGKGKDLTQLTIQDFQKHEKKITPDVFGALSVKGSVAKKNVIGGTAPTQVKAAISRAKRRIV